MRLIKKNDLHYLVHSFRINGRVVTKEKYLGRRIPANIEEIKRNFFKEIYSLKFYPALGRIKKIFLNEWKRIPESAKKDYWISKSVEFTYNTNSIEGSKISRKETEELLLHDLSPKKPIWDVKETLNHSKLFLRLMNKPEILNLKTILQWHKELFSETKPDLAGRLRNYLVRVGYYIAPDWQDLTKLLQRMFAWHEKNKKMNPVELAARMHYKFEMIHPFGDGNGRVGRLIIANILKENNFPIIIIEYRKRMNYYRSFRKDEECFVQYFFRTYIKQFKKYL